MRAECGGILCQRYTGALVHDILRALDVPISVNGTSSLAGGLRWSCRK